MRKGMAVAEQMNWVGDTEDGPWWLLLHGILNQAKKDAKYGDDYAATWLNEFVGEARLKIAAKPLPELALARRRRRYAEARVMNHARS